MNEFELIQAYFAAAAAEVVPDAQVVLGIGDDCALLQPPMGQQLAISTDTLVAGRHFPEQTDAFSIGWKAVAVNLSDLAAMGAMPHSILLALSLPSADEGFLRELSRGIFSICQQYGVRLIGGDTTRSPVLSLTLTALGWIPQGQAITRAGAQVGDWIVVTGTLGDAAFALQHLDSSLQHRLDRPTPRVAFGQALRGIAHAMLDISDGLRQDLGHILQASRVGAVLDVLALPLDPILRNLSLNQQVTYALVGGDDYELCFCIAPDAWQNVVQLADQHALAVTVVGRVTDSGTLQLMVGDQPYSCDQTGFMHFE
ncbi:MAG: thiamine-phosphate kinase [Pseudomonadota bacterium]|nr:thiamine-phosphate kinase [Pseudomonadota bacterium]